MSNIINKVKDAVAHHGDHKKEEHHSTGTTDANTYDSSRSSNYGPHGTNTANAADPRVDSDRSSYGTSGVAGSTGNYGTTGTTGTTGPTGTSSGYGTGATAGDAYDLNRSTNHGTHDSNIANKADPRIDSDRDGRASHGTTGLGGSTTGAYGSTGSTGYAPTSTHSSTTQPMTGSTGYAPTSTHSSTTTHPMTTGAASTGPTGTSTGYGTGATAGDAYDLNRSTNHGHHDSNIANKADPRIDSDRDGRASHGTTGLGGSTGTYGSTGATGTTAGTTGAYGSTGATGTTGAYGSVPSEHSAATGPASSTAGPHDSNVANKADPRVDSDQSKKKEHLAGEYSGVDRFDKDVHKGSIAGGNQVIGLHGSKGPTTTKNFDQSQHESAAGSSYNTGGQTTAGPHKSDTLNKLDPRVDSDLDGSKTIGGNQTGAQTQTQRY